MNTYCDHSELLRLYLDGELSGSDQEEFLLHVEGCTICQEGMEEIRAFSARLTSTKPFEAAPATLRDRIAAKLMEEQSYASPGALRVIHAIPARPHQKLARNLGPIAALLCVSIGCSLIIPQVRAESKANSFVATAVDTHRALANEGAQLDISSDSPAIVSAWFAGRVSFPFRMPNAGLASDDRAKYKLRGGRLVMFAGQRAAELSFQMPGEIVSVLIIPDKSARAMGGEVTYSDAIRLHSMDRGSLHVVTWENETLTYALISTGFSRGRNSCSTCHEGAADHTQSRPLSRSAERSSTNRSSTSGYFANAAPLPMTK